MFSHPHPAPMGRSPACVGAYRQIAAQTGVVDATPHRLVSMLYDGFFEALAEARGALRKRDAERKGRAIGRAVRIVEEGLRSGLNRGAGGGLAENLNDVYSYVALRLTQANLRNDEAALEECQHLMQPLRDAWVSIGGPGGQADA